MQELQELIAELGKSGADLEDALIKAQMVASKVDDPEFSAWVQAELEGYPDNNVPDYRKVTAHISGTLTDGFRLFKNQPIALAHLEPEQQDALRTVPATEGIGGIKLHAKQESEGQRFGTPIPPEICQILSMTYPNHSVHQAWKLPPTGAYQQILTQVRTRLLRFALALQKRIDASPPAAAGKAIMDQSALSHLLNGAHFGDHATITIQHTGTISVATGVQPGDLSALVQIVRDQGVSESEINNLKAAIAADATDETPKAPGFGARVASWFGSLGKTTGTAAMTAAARIAIEQAIHGYYGS